MVWMPDWMWEQKGGGKGKGGGGGSWMPPIWQPMFSKGWDGKGWGKGKGKGRNKKVDGAKTIWVGNLPTGVTFQELKTHGEQAGSAKWAEVFKFKGQGTGAIGYSSAEEAAAAIGILNGTVLNGSAITTDTWAKQSK
mmetsp:Transcript_86972/g.177138  ORF Transcript_86972/g.177138 Transcript_86972/m.177138 type:complete len:137 (+) Transcript_86972:68-478(+)